MKECRSKYRRRDPWHDEVRVRTRWKQRLTVGPPGHAGEAEQRGQRHAVARCRAPRALGTEHAELHDDDVVAQLAERVVPEPPFVHDLWCEVVDHHVGVRDQPPDDLSRARIAHVEGEALLSRVAATEQRAGIHARFANERRVHAERVDAVNRLDLDHLSAGLR